MIVKDTLARLSEDLSNLINIDSILGKVEKSSVPNMELNEYYTLVANTCANMSDIHPDYSKLAARVAMTGLHRDLRVGEMTFAERVTLLYNNKILGQKSTRISHETYKFIIEYESELEEIIDYSRDFTEWDYSAFCMIVKSNLQEIDNKPAETITQMHLRVACGIADNIEDVKEIYDMLSTRKLSVSSPVISNAGSKQNQMASCYLQYCEDSMVGDEYAETGKVGGVLKAMTQLAAQSKGRGGNAITITDIRGNGSPIRKVNGKSNGILPFMKMFDSTIGAVNQGGKRAGTCALYIEPWHSDILEFLDAGNHTTIEEKRCKNLFFGLWMNDLFFNRLVTDQANAKWTLFDPGEVLLHLEKPLSEYFGDEFVEKYEYLEGLGIGREIPLMEIWTRVCHLWQTTGMPYMVNKDEVNKKSNEQNLGTVKQSNLCTEITLVSDKDHTGVCVLASIVLPQFYISGDVDYAGIIHAARIATRTTNRIIDLQFYPTPETRNACLKRRPIGVGMQGLADLFHKLKLDFTSDKAKEINKKVYEAMYLGCVEESIEQAKKYGTYVGYEGSPASQGKLQYDLWGLSEKDLHFTRAWKKLKKQMKKYGLRNSELTALAPTAASSIRMGNAEMHEPYTRNVYVRSHIAGTTTVVNPYLVEELQELGLWNTALSEQIVQNEGSVQSLGIPQDLKDRYQTIYEIDWKALIDMNADRAPFISQTSSFNHYTSADEASPTLFTQKVLYAWRKRLKTLSYYMHTEAASTAKKEMAGTRSVEGCGEACQI